MNLSTRTAHHSGLLPADTRPLLTWCNFKGITWVLSLENLNDMYTVLLCEPEKSKASGILVSQLWLASVSKIDQKERKRREKEKVSK